MRLVDDQRVVAQQQPVPLHLGQQDAVRHDLDQGAVAGGVGKPDLVADHRPELGFELRGDPVGDGAGRDTPRLGMPDLAVDAAAELQADLRQLGCLARAGLARDDHDLVFLDRRRKLGLALADWQLGRVGDDRDNAAPRLDALLGRRDLGRKLPECLLAGIGVPHRQRPVRPPGQPALVGEHQRWQARSQLRERSGHSRSLQVAGAIGGRRVGPAERQAVGRTSHA